MSEQASKRAQYYFSIPSLPAPWHPHAAFREAGREGLGLHSYPPTRTHPTGRAGGAASLSLYKTLCQGSPFSTLPLLARSHSSRMANSGEGEFFAAPVWKMWLWVR